MQKNLKREKTKMNQVVKLPKKKVRQKINPKKKGKIMAKTKIIKMIKLKRKKMKTKKKKILKRFKKI